MRSDRHEHECRDPTCATVWAHTVDEALCDPHAHHCPKCGKEQYYKRKYLLQEKKRWDRARKEYSKVRLKRRVRYIFSLIASEKKEALKKANLQPICMDEADYMFDGLQP